MQSEEQRLIDGLFSRLKEAEAHSASRDASAEERIAQHVSAQPAAPYYMAQTILIQEAAIKQLNDRIQALESQVSQLQAAKPSSGGFLSGLFGGGGSSRGSDPIPGAEQYGRPQASAQPQYTPPPQQNYAPQAAARGGGFMAGALQTAAGVAGGVVLGNMLTNMFSGSQSISSKRSRSLMPPPRRTASRRTPPQVTIRSARETISSLPTIPGTTTSTPALATMILAAMTIAGFNPGDA
jgi:hypothetical protein